MSEKIFVGRKKEHDRDACFYVEKAKFECGHYFSKPHPEGACYSCGWEGFNHDSKEYDYDNIETVLTKKEYAEFRKLIDELDSFGYCLDKDEEKKKQAQVKADEINKFIDDKLRSKKAELFLNKIAKSEQEYIMKEYDIDEDEFDDILNNYNLDYFDRGIISQVYDDSVSVAERYIDEGVYGNVDDKLTYYIDYDKLGYDIIANDECFYELNDGRVVEYNY